MYNSDDAIMQTSAIVNSHYITEGQYVACILVTNLMVVLQWVEKGKCVRTLYVRIWVATCLKKEAR